MKRLFAMILALDFRGLFTRPSNEPVVQMFRYVFVGGISFLVDWGLLWALTRMGLYYLVAAAFAFLGGLACNFALSKRFVFSIAERTVPRSVEVTVFVAISVVGMLLTEGLMYLFTDVAGLYFMASKVLSAAIVLIWNFAGKKLILYRRGGRA